ncbi:MAG: response regulator, partial [Gemmatimonadota bacterium]
MDGASKRILWVDDEVELLEPHRMVLDRQGYAVDTTTNGDDALVMLRRRAYDLVLLDERMPGRTGLEVLEELRRAAPHARVVMVTKSEENRTLEQAIGRRVDDYLVKPTSPRQVLSVVKRLLEGPQLRQRQTARDLAARFAELSAARDRATDWHDYARLYAELIDWDIRLDETGEAGLADTVHSLLADVRRDFGDHVVRRYRRWVRDGAAHDERPMLSTDIVARRLVPMLDAAAPVYFVVVDCMRLDQWRSVRALVASEFDVDEELYCGVLPTATPYARNALFSGWFPDRIAVERPGWWETDEGSLNAFEDDLLVKQLERLTGREVPVHYEKIFTGVDTDALVGRVR